MKKIILVSLLTLAFVPARCEGVQQQAQDINDTTLQQQQPKGGVVIAKRVGKVLGLGLAGAAAAVGALIGSARGIVLTGAEVGLGLGVGLAGTAIGVAGARIAAARMGYITLQ